MIRATAPGKLVLLGEYAVLEGSPALAMAVNRRVSASIVPKAASAESVGDDCEVELRMDRHVKRGFNINETSGVDIVDAVIRNLARPTEGWRATIDSRPFFADDGRKLGIGSSAAVICATYGAFSALANLNDGSVALSKLLDVQRDVQGGGSGIDVAASLNGGVVEFVKPDAGDLQVTPRAWIEGLHLSCIFTGISAKTQDLLDLWRRWLSTAVDAKARVRALERASRRGCQAFAAGDTKEFIRYVAEYGRQMDSLGDTIGASIVTEAHRTLANLAGNLGGAYKPSGAGGGDVGIGVFAEDEALLAFEASARGAGYPPLDIGLDRQGLVVNIGKH